MHQSLHMPLPSTGFSRLPHEKLSTRLQCKAWGTSSKNAVTLLIVGKKASVSKEDAVSHARSTRSLPMRLVTVRKSLDAGAQAVVDNYVGKVKRYCNFEELQIRPNPKNTRFVIHRLLLHQATGRVFWFGSDVLAQVEAEGDRVLKSITPKDWVVLVDERGKDLSSEQFATSIAEAGDTGASALVFCIGGPYGHGSQVSQRANTSIRLSSMVLNHQVAMIVLLEQIYRAWTILRGEKYHH